MDKPNRLVLLFAAIVSRLFDPVILLPLLLVMSLVRTGMDAGLIVRTTGILLSIMVLPPILLLLWGVKTGRVSNWDMSVRSERVRALMVFSVFLLFDYFLILRLGIPPLVRMFSAMGVIFTGFFLVTLKFKLSGHMTTLVFFLVTCTVWFGMAVWPLLILVPLVAWSRLILKRHTLGQVVVGSGYGLAVALLCFQFGLIS